MLTPLQWRPHNITFPFFTPLKAFIARWVTHVEHSPSHSKTYVFVTAFSLLTRPHEASSGSCSGMLLW